VQLRLLRHLLVHHRCLHLLYRLHRSHLQQLHPDLLFHCRDLRGMLLQLCHLPDNLRHLSYLPHWHGPLWLHLCVFLLQGLLQQQRVVRLLLPFMRYLQWWYLCQLFVLPEHLCAFRYQLPLLLPHWLLQQHWNLHSLLLHLSHLPDNLCHLPHLPHWHGPLWLYLRDLLPDWAIQQCRDLYPVFFVVRHLQRRYLCQLFVLRGHLRPLRYQLPHVLPHWLLQQRWDLHSLLVQLSHLPNNLHHLSYLSYCHGPLWLHLCDLVPQGLLQQQRGLHLLLLYVCLLQWRYQLQLFVLRGHLRPLRYQLRPLLPHQLLQQRWDLHSLLPHLRDL